MLVCSTDSAKRDTIGQGQAIQRQALSGILGKIVSRKEAIAARCAVHCIEKHCSLQR